MLHTLQPAHLERKRKNAESAEMLERTFGVVRFRLVWPSVGMDITLRVRPARKHYGLTQSELGQALRMSRRAVIDWEMQRSTPTHGVRDTVAGFVTGEWVPMRTHKGVMLVSFPALVDMRLLDAPTWGDDPDDEQQLAWLEAALARANELRDAKFWEGKRQPIATSRDVTKSAFDSAALSKKSRVAALHRLPKCLLHEQLMAMEKHALKVLAKAAAKGSKSMASYRFPDALKQRIKIGADRAGLDEVDYVRSILFAVTPPLDETEGESA